MSRKEAAEKKSLSRENLLALMGNWSLISLISLLLFFTLRSHFSYTRLVKEIFAFLTGHLESISKVANGTTGSISVNVIAILLLDLAVNLIIGQFLGRKTKSFNFEEIQKMLDRGPGLMFFVILLEELVTRGFFLGLLTKVFPGKVSFYFLFLLGNLAWSLFHLTNFKDKKEWSPLIVIPQFVSGIFLTYVFLKYGLKVTILTHFLFNVIVLSSSKEKMASVKTFLVFFYYLFMGMVLFVVMKARGFSLAALSPWLNNSFQPLKGFGLIDYVIALLAVNCLVDLVSRVLLLDSIDADRSVFEKLNQQGGAFIFSAVFIGLFSAGFVLAGNFLLSFVIKDVTARIALLAVIDTLLSNTSSGSSLAQATLVNLPKVFFIIVAYIVLGFWPSVVLALLFFFFNYLPDYLESEPKPAS